jgi:hypothetical protein
MGKKSSKTEVWYKDLGEIRETITLTVSSAGGGYVIYLPKGLCRIHDIQSGDKVKVAFLNHYRPKTEE